MTPDRHRLDCATTTLKTVVSWFHSLLPFSQKKYNFLLPPVLEKKKKKERNRISIRRCASLSAGLGPFDPKLPSQDVVVLLIYLFDLYFCFLNLKRKGEIFLNSLWLSSGAVFPGS